MSHFLFDETLKGVTSHSGCRGSSPGLGFFQIKLKFLLNLFHKPLENTQLRGFFSNRLFRIKLSSNLSWISSTSYAAPLAFLLLYVSSFFFTVIVCLLYFKWNRCKKLCCVQWKFWWIPSIRMNYKSVYFNNILQTMHLVNLHIWGLINLNAFTNIL